MQCSGSGSENSRRLEHGSGIDDSALRPALADLPVLAVAARGCALGSVQPLPWRTG